MLLLVNSAHSFTLERRESVLGLSFIFPKWDLERLVPRRAYSAFVEAFLPLL